MSLIYIFVSDKTRTVVISESQSWDVYCNESITKTQRYQWGMVL